LRLAFLTPETHINYQRACCHSGATFSKRSLEKSIDRYWSFKSKALKNQDDFIQAARKLEDEAAKLAADAKIGDFNAIKAQFGAAAKTCKGCHGQFKSK
jgi:hypothetical protein